MGLGRIGNSKHGLNFGGRGRAWAHKTASLPSHVARQVTNFSHNRSPSRAHRAQHSISISVSYPNTHRSKRASEYGFNGRIRIRSSSSLSWSSPSLSRRQGRSWARDPEGRNSHLFLFLNEIQSKCCYFFSYLNYIRRFRNLRKSLHLVANWKTGELHWIIKYWLSSIQSPDFIQLLFRFWKTVVFFV